MKISISNIIWEKGKDNFENFLKLLKSNSIYNVELALNCIFEEPANISQKELSWLKTLLDKYNINVSALHSLTYTREDLAFFVNSEKRDELFEYILKYKDLAKALNTNNIVYGSPKSRKIYNYSKQEANQLFLYFLDNLDANMEDIIFNIEPLPVLYCEYLNTFIECANLISNKNYKNISIQLDVRTIIENKENIEEIFKHYEYIKHIHVGEPSLKMPSTEYKKVHKEIRKNLYACGYDKFITAEVIKNSNINDDIYLKKCIDSMREYYE